MAKLFVIFSILLSAHSFADVHDDLAELSDLFEHKISGRVSISPGVRDGERTLDFAGTDLRLTTTVANKIKFVLTGKIKELIDAKKLTFNNEYDLATFMREAYIEIKNIDGKPVALIMGKRNIFRGQSYRSMPVFRESPLFAHQTLRAVFGISVVLSEKMLLGIFDKIEASIYETSEKNNEIDHLGQQIKLSKRISDQLLMTVAESVELTDDSPSMTLSVGLIGHTKDKSVLGYVEGFIFSNNPEYPNTTMAVTLGTSLRVANKTNVIMELNLVQNYAHQVGLAVTHKPGKEVTLGIEARTTMDQNGDLSHYVGGNVTYKIGNIISVKTKNNSLQFESDFYQE